jgi:hypothetical protein
MPKATSILLASIVNFLHSQKLNQKMPLGIAPITNSDHPKVRRLPRHRFGLNEVAIVADWQTQTILGGWPWFLISLAITNTSGVPRPCKKRKDRARLRTGSTGEQKTNMLRFCTWFFERAQLR